MDFTPIIDTVAKQLLWLLPSFLLVSLLVAVPRWLIKRLAPRLRGIRGERTVARVLERHALRVANDVILPDSRGGLAQIDHLALTPTGILVIETKHYSGLILGREHEPHWTQVLGPRRHPFQNPLRQNYGHIKAVEALTTTLTAEGRVVFVGRARFPKGRPAGVLDLVGLQRELAAMPRREGPLETLLEWEDLIAQARHDRRARREHLAGLASRHAQQDPSAWPNAGSSSRGWLRLAFARLLQFGVALAIPFALFAALNHNLSSMSEQVPRIVAERPASLDHAVPPTPTSGRMQPPPRQLAPATTIASAPEEQPPLGQPEPPIRWADSPPSSVAWQRCNQARTAVLIDNSASNRQRRDHLCAAVQGSDAPDQPSGASGRSSMGGVEPWKTLHSAGD